MTITPFLALGLRGKKDAILARGRARRVASLLQFDPHEQACIAAGTFVIACQAFEQFKKPRLCFQIENQQLHVFAEDAAPARANRFADFMPETEPTPLYRLIKPLPAQDGPTEELDLGWLVTNIERTAREGAFDEVVRQNQEVLALLSEVRLYQASAKENGEKSPNPHAA